MIKNDAIPFQPSTQLLYLLPVLAFALCVAYQHFFSPLAGIPGPFGAIFSPMWMVKHACQGDMRRQMINPHSKYGKLVRTGPNEISVSDVEVIKKIYGSVEAHCPSPSP